MTIELGVSARLLAPAEADALSVRFIDYWHRLTQGHRAPSRRDVDPLDLRPWIGRIHLWERLYDGDFRCRIWPTHTTETSGSIREGSRASAMWPMPYGATVLEHYQKTMECKNPTVHRVKFAFQGENWTYDRVALPLAPSSDTPPMLLNYTVLGDRLPWQRLQAALDKVAEGKWGHGAAVKHVSAESSPTHRAMEALSGERRLVERVLRLWQEMATGQRWPTMANLDPWMVGDDWANCALVRLGADLWQSSFIFVGDRLAPAPDQSLDGLPLSTCPRSSVLGSLLKNLWRLRAHPQPLSVEGAAEHMDNPVLYRGVLMPLSEDGARMDTVFAAATCGEQRMDERSVQTGP